jgi:GH15 family glucan-1,4-alpha-glucosidase
MIGFLESAWKEPDEGIWEVRGPRRHFTHSKVMAWVAFDRGVNAVKTMGYEFDRIGDWESTRDAIHREVCARGFDPSRNTFVQAYDEPGLDASLLMIPLVGFLPATDPRVVGTVTAIQKDLMVKGFVHRYDTKTAVDGLPPGEGVFLPCTFWLVDNLALQGRRDEARELYGRLLSVRNDLGLLSEEYDPDARRLLGNFPQAFTHVCLANTARYLSRGAAGGPAERPRQAAGQVTPGGRRSAAARPPRPAGAGKPVQRQRDQGDPRGRRGHPDD